MAARSIAGRLLPDAKVSATPSSNSAASDANAHSQLETEWTQFVGRCMVKATIGGFARYVGLLACLEMARDARNPK
jgi:hypothetical protein